MKEIVCISCSIFRKEIEALKKANKIDIPFIFLDSMLHMEPNKLENHLLPLLDKEKKKGNKIIILYGDCSPNICNFEEANIKRVQSMNCIEIIIGKKEYKELIKKGAFFLMPEWIKRWEEIFKTHLRLDKKNGKILMTDLNKELIYINTGIENIQEKTLNEIGEFSGLKWRILNVSLDNLLNNIISTIERF